MLSLAIAQFAMESCAHWLNYKCGIDLVTAREKVRLRMRLPIAFTW
jgi:hypothetical protein